MGERLDMFTQRYILLALGISILLTATTQAKIIHVPADSATIQGGINGAGDGDTVLVTEGLYYERINFRGKAILLTSEFVNAGDTLHIQNTIIDADTLVLGVADTGSVLIFCNREDSNSVVKGFTLRNGNGTGIVIDHEHYVAGGGIHCEECSPTIIHCTITGNAAEWGGGVSCLSSAPIVTNCTITGNVGAGISGKYSWPIVSNCTIAENSGSGISLTSCGVTVSNCTISNNKGVGIGCSVDPFDRIHYGLSSAGIMNTIRDCRITGNRGGIWFSHLEEVGGTVSNCTITDNTGDNCGGIYCVYSLATISNCTVSGNSGRECGGIMYRTGGGTMSHCVITGNRGGTCGGILCSSGGGTVSNCTITGNHGGGVSTEETEPTFTSCILWANSPYEVSGRVVITYSDVQRGWEGEGNIDCDPWFCDPDVGNYYLAENSCCVGAGEGGTDIGALGIGCSVCGDCDGDGSITIADATYLVTFIYRWGPTPLGVGDVNRDGRSTIADATYIISFIYRGGPPPCEPPVGTPFREKRVER